MQTFFSSSLLQEALLYFAPDSAAGPSGLRPQNIEGGLFPCYRDEIERDFHAVLGIMAEGDIRGPLSPGSSVPHS